LLGTAMSAFWGASVAATEPPPARMDVALGIFLIDITNFNQQENTFEVELDVVTRWQDPQRAFTPPAGQPAWRIYRNNAASEELARGWAAEFTIVNSVGNPTLGVARTRIDADGTVVNRARVQGVLRANLDFRQFPFDAQDLPIQVESYAWPAAQLRIVEAKEFSGFGTHYEMPEWTLQDLVSEHQIIEREQTQESFERMTFHVHIQRKTGYYLWKILLPLLVITAISWVVFWMSEDALGRRAGVSSTGMLTVIAYQLILADSLPRFPYLTLMDKVALLTLVIIAMTMLENIIVTRLPADRRIRVDVACRVVFPLTYYASLALILGPLVF
jgi:hypothetical protein